jgi:hypothetical protein
MNTKLFLPLMFVITLAGCATQPLKGRADLLDFLADGKTTREEVITALGQPSGRFEKDRILTYRLGFQSETKSFYIVERESSPSIRGWATWMNANYSLVLIFDDTGILKKHSLDKVN